MAPHKDSAVKLDNMCRAKHWAIEWEDVDNSKENRDVELSSRWHSAVTINGRRYAWGVGAKKGHARDKAAEQLREIFGEFGEDSIAKLDDLVLRQGLRLEWSHVPDPRRPTALVWMTTAIVNGTPYGTGVSTHQECARVEAAKQTLDILKARFSLT